MSKDLDASSAAGQEKLNALASEAIGAGWRFIGLTNAPSSQNEEFRSIHAAPYTLFTCDQTELKIVVRSNPGLVWIHDGVIQDKWSWKDFPDFGQLKN